MDIHPAVDTESRYDVVLISSEPRGAAVKRIQTAIENQLQLSVTTETRWMDIWVLTAPPNPVARAPA